MIRLIPALALALTLAGPAAHASPLITIKNINRWDVGIVTENSQIIRAVAQTGVWLPDGSISRVSIERKTKAGLSLVLQMDMPTWRTASSMVSDDGDKLRITAYLAGRSWEFDQVTKGDDGYLSLSVSDDQYLANFVDELASKWSASSMTLAVQMEKSDGSIETLKSYGFSLAGSAEAIGLVGSLVP